MHSHGRRTKHKEGNRRRRQNEDYNDDRKRAQERHIGIFSRALHARREGSGT